jgi:dihydropteroate synthase
MGVINVTPDSFSDGGRHADSVAAVTHALRMIDEGAGLIDVGGESTRPGAPSVSVETEIERVVPVIEALAARTKIPISIDTS